MSFAEYGDYDALGLAQLVRRKEVTPVELLEEAIARIERHNPKLNAVVYKAYDDARATAGAKLPEGPFKGIPFLIKDINLPVAGWPMTGRLMSLIRKGMPLNGPSGNLAPAVARASS